MPQPTISITIIAIKQDDDNEQPHKTYTKFPLYTKPFGFEDKYMQIIWRSSIVGRANLTQDTNHLH